MKEEDFDKSIHELEAAFEQLDGLYQDVKRIADAINQVKGMFVKQGLSPESGERLAVAVIVKALGGKG